MATKPTKTEQAPSLEGFDLALKLMIAACGVTPTFILSPHPKGGCLVSVSASGSEASIRVPVTVNGLTEPLDVPTDSFSSALRGRKNGTLVCTGTSLTIKAGSYSGTVNTNAASAAITITPPEGKVQEFVLTPDLHAFLISKLPLVRIERIHSALPDVLLNLRVSPKSWYLGTYDAQQLCFLSSKPPSDIGTFKILLPYGRFSTFVKDLPVANCKVIVSEDALMVTSPQFKLKLALPHIEEDSHADPDSAYAKATEVRKVTGEPFVMSAAMLAAFLDNSRSLLSVGTEVKFTPAKGGTRISVLSAAGENKLQVKGASVSTEFGLDYRFVQTLLSKQAKPKRNSDEEPVDDTVTFELVDNTFVICKSSATYLAILSADGAEAEEAAEEE